MNTWTLKRANLDTWGRIAGVLGVVTLMAISARVSIWLPFSPVPLTLQVLVVVLSGFALGSRRGALAQLLYLQAILFGAPASASAVVGPAALVGPTAGYLWSFPIAAFLAGWMANRVVGKPSVNRVLGGLAALAVIYVMGMAWLSRFAGGWAQAWQWGGAPFVIADLAKILLAAAVLSTRGR